MGLYGNWDYGDPHHQPSPVDLAAWPNSVGGHIMHTAAGANVGTVLGMTGLVAAFQTIGWTWDPGRSGRGEGAGKTLLDRTVAGRGECGWLAAALHILLRTPVPYGFGQANSVIRIYSGLDGADPDWTTQGDGFVAQHNGLHHALPANVCMYAPAVNPVPLENLYKWGDHAVVEFPVGGVAYFWDPSYNTSYLQITDMALYRIRNVEIVGQNMNYELATGRWLRHRTGNENNYNMHSVYLMSTNNNRVPAPPAPVRRRHSVLADQDPDESGCSKCCIVM